MQMSARRALFCPPRGAREELEKGTGKRVSRVLEGQQGEADTGSSKDTAPRGCLMETSRGGKKCVCLELKQLCVGVVRETECENR